jgi:acyl carrier protein
MSPGLQPLAKVQAAALDEVAAKVMAAWTEVLKIGDLAPDTSFFDAGGTSIQALQIVRIIRRAFSIEFPVSLFLQAGTPEALAAAVRSKLADPSRK